MKIVVDEKDPRFAVVQLKSRLDMLFAPEFKNRLAETVKAGHTHLVIDLGEVAFVDSSGLGALISGLKSARLAGGDLRLARPGEQARYSLRISTLDRVLTTHPSVEEALASLR